MNDSLHRGYQIRSGGADRAAVKRMLQNVDADGDGIVAQKEISALAQKGRDSGFKDEGALKLFHAGIDAAALAEQKTAEKGQQLSADYLDKSMKPFLEKAYGKAGGDAMEIVAPQASRELTKDAAERIESRASFDKFEKSSIKGVLRPAGGAESYLQDTNKNGKVDAKDRQLISDGKGGFRWMLLGQNKADEINGNAGLNRAGEALAEKPHFPDTGPEFTQRDQYKKWLGGKSHEDGGAWKTEKFWKNEGDEKIYYPQYKLDTSRMKGSEALDAIAKNPKNYCMDCAMGKQFAQLQRVRSALGDDAFNRLVEKEGMSIGYGAAANQDGLLKKIVSPAADTNTDTKVQDYQPGMQGYAEVNVSDPGLMNKLARAGWAGEHFTMKVNDKGEKVAVAHPFGEIPAKDFDQRLRQQVCDSAKRAGYELKPEDVIITYERPEQVDIAKARELAGS